MNLANKRCIPCEGGVVPIKGKLLNKYLKEVKGWKAVKQHHLEKEFKFKNFKEALKFVNKVGSIAEKENHHPNIYFTWGKVRISIWTHAIDGLSENDFILAAKIDHL